MQQTIDALSDGKPCTVTVLGLYDLDRTLADIGPALAGPYVYETEMADGSTAADMFDIHSWSKPPEYPGLPKGELRKFSPQWYALLTYQVYGAAVAHEVINRLPGAFEYIKRLSKEILDRCVNTEDHGRIVDYEDWQKIFDAVYIQDVTKEDIADSFRINFGALFGDQEIFDAMKVVRKGAGRYNFVRWCQMEAMMKSGFRREDQWAALPHAERVRRTAQVALPMLMETLASDRAQKEAEAKARQK